VTIFRNYGFVRSQDEYTLRPQRDPAENVGAVSLANYVNGPKESVLGCLPRKRPPTEAALLVPGALAAVALKHADGFFSLQVVDRPDQSQLVIAKTALSEWVAVTLEISKLSPP
jgi:hypothetical protein